MLTEYILYQLCISRLSYSFNFALKPVRISGFVLQQLAHDLVLSLSIIFQQSVSKAAFRSNGN